MTVYAENWQRQNTYVYVFDNQSLLLTRLESQKIAMLSREQENVVAQNDDLQNELDMYKSIQVPLEKKTRTNITRVGRPPLVNLGNSLNSSLPVTHVSNASKNLSVSKEPLLEVINDGDMTTDELM